MTNKRISIALMVVAMLLGVNLAVAATPATDKAAEVADRTPAAVKKPAHAKTVANSKTKAKVKPVDINSANKVALKKLPGITDALADKIIAGRPYGSKTWLLTNNVMDANTFYAIKPLIEAKQPFATAAENAAYYEKMKKEKAAKP